MTGKTTRDHIVEAADQIFYQRGYEHTSFADIAAAVQISRGNFYYHFKSKDEILAAVIGRRLTNTTQMLEAWEAEGDGPRDRIRRFLHILIANRAQIMAFGCPVGTLCNELAKLDHAAQPEAAGIFRLFRDWLAGQFTRLGYAAEAENLALRLLVFSQGMATIATALRDEAFIRQEVARMDDWLETLGPPGTLQKETLPCS